jgi:hypothetical protein
MLSNTRKRYAMAAVDDIIGRWIKQAEKTGELARSDLFGKPLDLDDSSARTPEQLRMAHKVLKNAGYVPAEVEAMQRIAALKKTLQTAADESERTMLRREIAEQQQKLSVRLDRRRR